MPKILKRMKIIKGFVALVLVAGILLFADRKNASWYNTQTRTKLFTIVEVDYNLSTTTEETHSGIMEGLRLAGLQEGTHFFMKRFNAQGDVATLNSIINVVAASEADLVFAISTPTTQAALNKINNIPVVFANVGDPVGIGAGRSFEDHHPNFTGVSVMSDFEGAIALLKKIRPGIKTIGTLFCPAESNSVEYKNRLLDEATRNNIRLIAKPVNTATDIPDALLSLFATDIELLTQISDNLTNASFDNIIKLATEHRMPCFVFVSTQVKKGAFAALSRDYFQNGVDAAGMAVRILHGEAPVHIPFQLVSKTNLVINKKVSDQFGIAYSDDLLAGAIIIE